LYENQVFWMINQVGFKFGDFLYEGVNFLLNKLEFMKELIDTKSSWVDFPTIPCEIKFPTMSTPQYCL